MNPFSCSRLRASQSCPFQARSFSCSVRDSSASTVSSMASCIQLSVLGHCTPPSIKGGMETSDFSNLGNKRGCKPACCFSSWIAAQNLESQRLSLPIARPVLRLQHHAPQNRIHPGLVTAPLRFQPFEYIPIQTCGDQRLGRLAKLAPNGRLPLFIAQLRNVTRIDFFVWQGSQTG